jgi:hypothetical protein
MLFIYFCEQNKMERDRVEYIAPPESEIREFDNKAQLDEYFAEHYDEYKSMSSHRLNQLFRLPGYKFVKRKGNIMLLNICDTKAKSIDKIPLPDLYPEIEQVRTKIKQLDDLVNLILQSLQENHLLNI